MDITFKNRKIQQICTNPRIAERHYGCRMAEKIDMRMNELLAAENVEEMVRFHIGRCHSLLGNRNGQYAVELVQPYRLVFEKKGDTIQIANILEIVDYH